ncbi:MAG: 50S ribosomal protein L24 [bacterium]
MKIVKGDIVLLRAGKDVAALDSSKKTQGVRGKVIRVLTKADKVVIEGVNMVTRHKKAGQSAGAAAIQQSGRIEMEAPVPVSRVMLVCSNCDKPTRIGTKLRQDTRQLLKGNKTVLVRDRVCKKCGEVIRRPTEDRLRLG